MFKVHQSPTKAMGLSADLASAPGPAQSDLWLPHPSLASCVRAILSRNTLGLALSDGQRYNHFPAAPTCSITWYLSGHCDVLDPGCAATSDSPRSPLPARIVFGGPHNRPLISWNPGPIHAVMLLLLPDAFFALTGIDPGAYVNRIAPADQVLDARWMAFCQAVDNAPDDDCRVAQIESFLNPAWQQTRPDDPLPVRFLSDWSQSLALRAATSGWGRSMRQAERRIKQWTGQPLRELRGVGRSERAFFEVLTALEDGALNWTEVANTVGYSDQSHLCRQTRRITGFSPDELRHLIATDESFWIYRLWGFSETTPGD